MEASDDWPGMQPAQCGVDWFEVGMAISDTPSLCVALCDHGLSSVLPPGLQDWQQGWQMSHSQHHGPVHPALTASMMHRALSRSELWLLARTLSSVFAVLPSTDPLRHLPAAVAENVASHFVRPCSALGTHLAGHGRSR